MKAHFNLLAITRFIVEENFNSFLKLHANLFHSYSFNYFNIGSAGNFLQSKPELNFSPMLPYVNH